MLRLLSQIWFILFELLRAPFDALTGHNRRQYSLSIDVAAPKAVTWAVASSHSVRLEGVPPIEIIATQDPARPGVYTGRLKIGDRDFAMAYRVLEERPGEAMSLEIIKSESAPECCPGEDYVCAFAVAGDQTNSVITSTYQITHTRLSSRLMMPLSAVQNIRRLKRNAELRAGVRPDSTSEQLMNAVITGALTFASFFALYGLSAAAMLIVLILLHEIGHVIAMKWSGIPVKGIYFIPFFGGAAVGADRYRSEAERGLISLMGPGFSLISTALFWWLSAQGNDEWMRDLAFMSALINGFNLLPIMPLDGGHVSYALLSRLGPGITRQFQIFALLLGGALALWLKSFLFLLLLLLVAPSLTAERTSQRTSLRPLTPTQWALLAIAYMATAAFYLNAAVQLSAPLPAGS